MKQDFTAKLGLKENIYEKDYDRHIAYITFNNPQKLNAYTSKTITELLGVWKDFEDDHDVWLAIVSGAGRAFGAGHELPVSREKKDPSYYNLAEMEPPSIHYGSLDIFKPIIAAVHGFALGGHCSFLLGCDIAVAAEGTKFGYPQPSYGVTSLGGHQRLPKATSPKIAMEIMLTAENFDAQDFYRWGLINKVVPADKLMEETEKFADRILKNAPLAIWCTKEDFIRGQRFNYLPDGPRFAALNSIRLRFSEDLQEGIKAFSEKRKPNWKAK
jgi:enoyl-CoA hydratase/carnithine racemase